MKAFINDKFGTPDVMKLAEIAKPVPKSNKVLIRNLAASVNPADYHMLRGTPRFFRIMGMGLFKPKHRALGSDVAGIVEAAGDDIKNFKVGDTVFGELSGGGFAEFSLAKEDQIVKKPEAVSFKSAAGIGIAATTARWALFEKGNLQPGQKVLIIGASGGVGTFAVQMAKATKAHVTAVCSSRNVELVSSLGADRVIAYDKTDILKLDNEFDLIADVAGALTIPQQKKVLTKNGRGITVGVDSFSRLVAFMIRAPFASSKKGKSFVVLTIKTRPEDLIYAADLIATGNMKTLIDREYPFDQVKEAMHYQITKRVRGKVIINIADNIS